MSDETTRIGVGAAIAADGGGTSVVSDLRSADDKAPPPRTPRWTWQAVLAFATAFTGASAVLLHLIGNAFHEAYFSQWGIDTGPFPKSSDWLVTMGYYGISNALATAALAMLEHWYVVMLSGIGLAFYLWLLFSPWNPFDSLGKWSTLMPSLPKWARKSLLVATVGALMSVLSLPIIFLLVIFIGIPAEIGRGIGEGVAQREAKDFEKGCEASKRKCIRLLRDGSPVGEGYLLESSQTHIAFLDVSMQRVRIVPREDLELQPLRLPTAK
ncbi:MAG: hypothetical protein GTN84_03270 [Hydrogenophaga sp.]|uniref:hypothetical protein n=1 Tax=Hydrogenophaga sp. TaxID=1904254 RepID=UPI0016AE8738|nr:hypothetical protein [Hydrogenophaga sp.]NIM40232.1 hypothetical protein [Hydrogenophaga sp.]NIN25463.1 hypothetical protein [Hydrogenophaga sp.]NIN30115.1 hypothetical protein [Hydrogenophaga sp.]NIN54416.1 hypothetical protein [Hydrogenophaga sp.]NIO50289.1 hypothetical protein [Hydrogenophaga sp.]